MARFGRSTLCLKKVPTFKLYVTLSNLNRFSKFLHCWKACEICYKTIQQYRLNLGMLLHYLGKLKFQIFYRYSAHMKEHANKLNFKCTDSHSSTHVCMRGCWGYLYVFTKILFSSLNTMLIVDKHCSDVCYDKFQVPQIDRKSKQVKIVAWKILFAISMGKNSIF